jgi:hypothetical protein
MKELSNYINEKLDINKVNLNNIKFPINGTSSEIIEFLEKNGFEKILIHSLKLMNQLKAPFYWHGGDDLYIGNTSNEQIHFETNPLLHMTFSNKKTRYGLDGPQSEENEFP